MNPSHEKKERRYTIVISRTYNKIKKIKHKEYKHGNDISDVMSK